MYKLITGCCCVIVLWATPATANTVYRCSDADGNLTFTRQGCPVDQASQVQEAVNPTPGSGKAVPLAKPIKQSKARRAGSSRELTVVGTDDDGCGNLITRRAKRDALIKRKVLAGMSRADVESAFGSPDAVTTRDGKVQYRYTSRKGRTNTVNFDQHGCTRGKNK